ncbi:hypothetical protein EV652_11484 [Kribbella steppae]|uniref:Uncharacterized protein n=1 Tax=Kribbella steppae TaxID=2512223 RepID=A0A4R2H2L2_9ACTN|nr:hypothetical protein [Kribbella steppae]TCO19105.1 hypothetical protein EV652_11484 [Kribbella steppae]
MWAMLGVVAIEDLRRAIQQLGEREGMTAARLEDSPLYDLMANIPPGWSPADRAAALGRLIIELVNGISSINLRSAARVALNLQESGSTGRSARIRWSAFANSEGANERTARNWWYEAALTLSRIIPERIHEVNAAGDWPKYRVHGVSGQARESLPPYRFARIDSCFWFEGRVGSRSVTNRRVVALEDGVDRILAVGRYYADPRPGTAQIVPQMNCELGKIREGRGMTAVELRLPEPLGRGQETFISYEIQYHSDQDCEPVVNHEVTAASVGLYVVRVQFDPDQIPESVWFFSARTDVEALLEPAAAEVDRLVNVSQLGYVDHRFHDCEYGVSYGLAWAWPQARPDSVPDRVKAGLNGGRE